MLRDYSPRFVLGRGVIVEGRVSTRPIVEHLDVFEDVLFRFRSYGIVPMVHELALQRSKETFHAGVAPQVPLRLMLAVMPCLVRICWYCLVAY